MTEDKPKRIPEILAEIDFLYLKDIVIAISITIQKPVILGMSFLNMGKLVPLSPSLAYFYRGNIKRFSKILNDLYSIPKMCLELMKTLDRYSNGERNSVTQ